MTFVILELVAAAAVAVWTLRQYWQLRYERARLKAAGGLPPFRGLRLVITRTGSRPPAATPSAVLPFLRPLTTTNHQLTTTKGKSHA